MSNKTKIVVLKSKELIYTGIFLFLGIVLIFVLYFMFSSNHKDKSKPNAIETAVYKSGIYTSDINLGGSNTQLSVTVDNNKVTNVSLSSMDETITTIYPLLEPTLEEINSQITSVDSLEEISFSADNQYTTILIIDAIEVALEDALINDSPNTCIE